MEALLAGTSQIEEMSKRLADRYGFMMGRTRTERAELSDAYADVLKLRGQLVHARLPRLTQKEQSKLRQVQGMLSDVIRHELRVLAK
jgi:hypothetical protein